MLICMCKSKNKRIEKTERKNIMSEHIPEEQASPTVEDGSVMDEAKRFVYADNTYANRIISENKKIVGLDFRTDIEREGQRIAEEIDAGSPTSVQLGRVANETAQLSAEIHDRVSETERDRELNTGRAFRHYKNNEDIYIDDALKDAEAVGVEVDYGGSTSGSDKEAIEGSHVEDSHEDSDGVEEESISISSKIEEVRSTVADLLETYRLADNNFINPIRDHAADNDIGYDFKDGSGNVLTLDLGSDTLGRTKIMSKNGDGERVDIFMASPHGDKDPDSIELGEIHKKDDSGFDRLIVHRLDDETSKSTALLLLSKMEEIIRASEEAFRERAGDVSATQLGIVKELLNPKE